jgi:8-oxo-dGTP diphosphatase
MNQEKKNPLVTVDIIIEIAGRGIVLIERKNPPYGWALPGGFVDYGESLEHAAVREAKEETSLDVKLVEQFHSYSDPGRDPRHHTISTVFIAIAEGTPRGQDDARAAEIFREENLPASIVFDHPQILRDYFDYKKTGQRPKVRA